MIKENQAEFDKTNLTTWLKAGYTGSRNTIVVLDDKAYPLKSDNVIEPLLDNTDIPYHKTMVCSAIRQLQPDVRVIAFSWFGSKKDEIIDWIIEHKAEIDMVNCSFSSAISTTEEKLRRIYDAGIPIFASSGNSEDGGIVDKIARPAKFDFTIAVGAWEELRDRKADYSKYGPELDIVAYTDIYIPRSDGQGVREFGGTSASAPVACCLYSAYLDWRKEQGLPKLTPEEVRKFVRTNTIDKLEPGFDIKSGYGLFVLPKEIPTVGANPKPIDKPIEKGDENMPRFTDTKGHWGEGAIDFVADKGLMKGYEEGQPGPADDTFKPDAPVTRAELATVLARMNGYVEKK